MVMGKNGGKMRESPAGMDTMFVLPYNNSKPRIITRDVNRKTRYANLYALANDNKA